MRSERKRKHSLLAKFMVLFMIINLLSGVNPSVVKAEETKTWGFDNNGKTAGNQQVRLVETGVESTYQDGKFDVKLEVEGNIETIANNKKLDVVLVVDRSGSMNLDNRMENAKKAAKNFVDKLIDGGNGKVRIGLVSYAGTSAADRAKPDLTITQLQSNKENLKTTIDSYNGDGGTFTQAALREADKLFENNDNEKIIVLISDGEPTYSYGFQPDFRYREKANSNVEKKGYEIWSVPVNENGEYDFGKWKKGYKTSSYRGGWLWQEKWTYVPHYVKIVNNKIEGEGNKTSEYDKTRTIAEAKSIKNKGIRIFSVGIGVNAVGKEILTKVASTNHYNDANKSASDLSGLLSEIADQLRFSVSNADLELVMNDKIEFKNADDLKKIEVKVVNKNSGAETADKSKAIKETAKWNVATKTLSFSGITLDKDEVLNITYKAELVETYKDGGFKPLNASAVLYPKGKQAESDNKLNFIIPSVKDMKTVNLTINKQWVGGKVPAGVESVKFNINAGNTELEEVVEVKSNENWIGKYNALPKYKDGTPIAYTVKEVKGANYEIVGEIKKETTSEGFTFTATNRNTETINFTVKKDWSTTPDELKIEVAVKLYANGKYERTENIIDDEAIFKNLPKYDVAGNEIKYTVKEALDNGKEEENGMITFGEYTYNVKYSYNDNGATITNTSTDASKVKFEATVKKHWVGGASLSKLKFVVKNDSTSEEQVVKMSAADFPNENWETTIELPKYNDDNTLATYTVTEEKVEGYTANKYEVTGINANNPIAEFTNTRNTQKITVTKDWGATPAEFIKDITVVLTGEAKDYKDVKTMTIPVGKKSVEFTVPTHTNDGEEIKYTASEQGVNDGKVIIDGKEFEVTHREPYTVVNTYTGLEKDVVKLTIVKRWQGDGRSAVEFEVKDEKGEKATDNIVLNNDPWTATVELPMWDKATGKLKTYTVNEVKTTPTFDLYPFLKEDENIISGKDKTVTFTNMRVMRTLTLEKKWVGNPGDQAEFELSGNGNEKITLSKDKWKLEKDLPVYSLDGNPIQYTITEKKIEGYDADSYTKRFTLVDDSKAPTNASVTFINTKMLDLNKPFTVYKTWDGKPAKSVSFGLFADNENEPKENITLTRSGTQIPSNNQNVWTGTFKKELPEYKLVNGEVRKITYVVKELNEKGEPVGIEDTVILEGRTYKVVSNFDEEKNTFNFFNTDITTGDITYTKEWKGEKSDGASFGLFISKAGELERVTKDNEKIPAASADENGKITFKDVDLAKHSKDDYVVRELNKEGKPVEDKATIELNDTTPVQGDSVVKKYQVTYDDAKRIITNTELIDITVKKTWADNVPQSEQQSVTVGVFYDGVQKEEVELNSNHSWTGKFENLPYVEDGYQVKETKINGINVDDSLQKLYTINVGNGTEIKTSGEVKVTNSFNLPKAEEGKIKVLKQWTINPTKEITVKLYKKTVATPAAPSIWVEVDAKQLNNGSVLEAEFAEPTDAEDYQILETAIGNLALTENEIQSILNSDDLDTVQYKIGDYEVSVQELDDDVFFIKNANDNLLTEVTATKQWSAKTIEKNKKPVKVQLFADINGVLEAIGSPVELNAGNQWSTKFKGLDKFDGEKGINYYVAEVGTEKTNITLDDITRGYKLGNSNVTITGDAKQGFVITNDVNLIDVTAEKVWENGATAVPAKFTLYRRLGIEFTEVSSKTLDGTQGWIVTFEDQPRVDETTGEDYFYYVFETEINNITVGINPLTGEGYEVDPLLQVITYTTGDINNGRYSVVIHGNAANGEKITIKNTFKPNVVPVIPGGDTPGGIPVIPVVTPDPLPTPTPNPSTPVVDVPDVPSPQGPATPIDGDDEDGFEEIDEDDIPQDGNIDETDDADEDGEETTDITDNKAPKGTPKLPKTGGETGNFLSIIGLGLIGLGLVIRRRR